MKNRKLIFIITIFAVISLFVIGCSDKNQVTETEQVSKTISEESEVIESETEKEIVEVVDETEEVVLKIGASPNVVEVVNAIEVPLSEKGYSLEVVPFDDIQQPNVALDEGSLDGNLYQHEPFLNAYNSDKGTDLFFTEPLFGGYTALYSEKWTSVEEIPENAQIGIFQDGSNQERALVLAEEVGLITLSEKGEDELYNLLSIKENPKNIEFIPLDTGGLNNGLLDLDAVFNQGTSMYLDGKDPSTYIVKEEDNSKYGMGLVVRKEDKDADWISDFIDAFRDERTKTKINDFYQGSYDFFD